MDVSVAELDPWATLPALGACSKLKELCLLLREPMAAEVGVVDVAALPAGLASLALRHVVLTGSDIAAGRCGPRWAAPGAHSLLLSPVQVCLPLQVHTPAESLSRAPRARLLSG